MPPTQDPLIPADCPYSVRKLKTCEGREGQAYSYELWRDGRKVGDVGNAGDGGCTDIRIYTETRHADYAALSDYVKALGFAGHEPDENFADALMDLHQCIAKYRRKCKTHLVLLADERLLTVKLGKDTWQATLAYVKTDPAFPRTPYYVINERIAA
jgi:hypothetical protein